MNATRGLLLICVGIAGLVISGLQHRPLLDARQQYQLQVVPPEDTTPLVSLTTVAFGGFRGLVADALWIRANEMQRKGQFFELVQLSKWITQLEPRLPEVWSFQAWNLSYNVSVLFPDDQSRWRWVRHGISLLRDEGRKHNPGNANLHWDLGWMYQHKIGFDSDLSHFYYKSELAQEMEALFGGPTPDITAPAPEGLSSYGLEWETIQELHDAVGVLDWRLPETHSLYWAWRGRPYATSVFDRMSMQRMIFQSLSTLVRRGQLLSDPSNTDFITAPRPDLIPATRAAYQEAFELPMKHQTTRNAYRAFLADAAILQFEAGNNTQAQTLFAEHLEYVPSHETKPSFQQLIQYHFYQVDISELSRTTIQQRICQLLRQHLRLRKNGNIDQANPLRAAALETYEAYQNLRPGKQLQKRTGLPPFERIEQLITRLEENADNP